MKPSPQPPRPGRLLRELDVADDRVELPVADRAASRTRGITYGPIRTASATWRGVASTSGGGTRAGDVAALGDDLVAAGAVLGEERLALREVAELPASASGSAGPPKLAT